MSYKLFLDDKRDPSDVYGGMNSCRDDPEPDLDWIVARSYREFAKALSEHGIPSFVSYDYQLDDWDPSASNGKNCAYRMMRVVRLKDQEHPPYHVHSSSKDGAANIHDIILN